MFRIPHVAVTPAHGQRSRGRCVKLSKQSQHALPPNDGGAHLQLGNIGLALAAVVVLTKAVKGTTLAPLRVYLWAAGGAFVTWRITSTTVRRLVRYSWHE